MADRYTLLLAGESGMGIDSSGEIIAGALAKLGFRTISDREYPSLIKGGLSTYHLQFGTERLRGLTTRYEIGVGLGKNGLLHCLETIVPGGVIFHNFERWKEGVPDLMEQAEKNHQKVFYIPTREICHRHKISYLFENTILIGAIAKGLNMSYEAIETALHTRYGKKEALWQMNQTCLQEGYACIQQAVLALPDLSGNEPRMIIDGNRALALGAIHAGVRTYFAYPMSPSSSILDYFAATAPLTGIVVKQAEDEITAIQMNIGASYAGTRALTATSGGGFDLMSESISLSGMIEVPCVIVIAQRPGPATGLPTWTAQADLQLALYAGHGEFTRLVVAVSDQESAFHLIQQAFNYAELYQIPCIVLTEKAVAENHATIPVLELGTVSVARGLITDADDLLHLDRMERYQVTKTGVSKRWLPTSSPTIYFTNGDEHAEDGTLDETSNIENMYRKRLQKGATLREVLPDPLIFGDPHASLGIIGRGGSKMAILDAIQELSDQGIAVAYLHIERLWPLKTQPILSFLNDKSHIALIENNATGQLAQLIKQELGVDIPHKYCKADGRSLFVDEVIDYIKTTFTL